MICKKTVSKRWCIEITVHSMVFFAGPLIPVEGEGHSMKRIKILHPERNVSRVVAF